MLLVRQRDWLRVVTTPMRERWRVASRHRGRRLRFAATAAMWWHGLRRRAGCSLLLRLPPSQFRRWNPRADGGVATIIAVAMIAVLLALTAGGAAVGSAVVARHRAQAAADLSALAGAQHALYGVTPACAEAGAVARRMGAVVAGCTVEDLDVVVAVSVPVMLGRFGARPARAAARAGPIGEGG